MNHLERFIGVMEYQGNQAQPLVWDNDFWRTHYAPLAAKLTAMLTPVKSL